MKLSAQLIIYHLHQRFSLAASSWLSCEPYLECPVIYQPPEALSDGRIYICDDEEGILMPSITCPKLWWYRREIPVSGRGRYPNLCILKERHTPAEVLGFLQEIFLKYENWNQSIFERDPYPAFCSKAH